MADPFLPLAKGITTQSEYHDLHSLHKNSPALPAQHQQARTGFGPARGAVAWKRQPSHAMVLQCLNAQGDELE